MPIGGRAVSFNVGRLPLSLSCSFGDFDGCCAVSIAAASTKETIELVILSQHCTVRAESGQADQGVRGDNNRMVYTQSALPSVDADMLVVPWFEGDTASAVEGMNSATG